MPRRFLTGDPVLITRRRAVTAVVILTIVYVFQGVIQGCAIHETRKLARKAETQAREGKQAHDGLCARKRNIAHRVNDTLAILDENPTAPFGIPAKLILRGVDRDLEEFDGLAAVKCDPPVAPPRRPKEK